MSKAFTVAPDLRRRLPAGGSITRQAARDHTVETAEQQASTEREAVLYGAVLFAF